MSDNILERCRHIKALVLDVDGILTDCRIFLDSQGEWRRLFSIRDGYGIRRLLEKGFIVGIITASTGADITERVKVLKIPYFYNGCLDKLPAFEDFLKKTGLQPQQVAYMGDDTLDIPVLERVGLAVTVADALEEVMGYVHYVARRPAGNGAVREVCELILSCQKG